jgi:hypothetical protein
MTASAKADDDEKIILTPAEAESLLADDGDVHNFIQRGPMFIGCDFSRESALAAFKRAKQIELGGENCKAMKHPLAVWDENERLSFFAADMTKVEAFETARSAKSAA